MTRDITENLKIAIIGAAGQQGREYYHLLEKKPVTNLVDSDLENLVLHYSNKKKLQFFSSVKEAVKNSNFNVAIVCLPHFSHLKITLYLSEHNKFIIKEEPLALSLSEVEKYKNSISPLILIIVQRQFNPIFINAKKDLSILGRIYNYTYEYNLNPPKITGRWKSIFECTGGGVLIDTGYHALDIILSFFGKPEKITAELSFCYNEMQNVQLEDTANLLLSHKNNQIHVTLNLVRHHSQKNEYFKLLDQPDFVNNNFNHNANIVEVVENSYLTSRKRSL
jgi:predicted dehydrogenase